ncbi:membrane-bound transcription factor site-2 protease [Lethenteron reissneri]|uniref:membrane-bound transcription factor site-2 protease n=1 Tax=Lethenteron reissneri TaxID=7753 RepID=UPI002AB6E62D|nr:membrane-bound transcription factor site-2 protease [Lethenteron reissneri]
MAFATSALVLLSFWALVSALDALIRASWLGTRYEHWMTTHSVAVSPGHVRWSSTILNRAFLRAGHWRPRLLHIWFTAGLVFGLAGMVLSVVLLTSNLASMLRILLFPAPAQQQQQQQQVLQVIVPGVNLPLSQASYFFLAVLLSGVVHEFGHAVAAVKEQVRVNGFGCFLFVLYPGAFVELHTPHLQLASPSQQLRIFCAGVWHNFVLVVVAALALLLMPWALALFYRTGAGALVTAVVEDSGVGGGLGLRVGDVVTTVGECRVDGAARWAGCLVEEAARPARGFCLSSTSLHFLLLQRPAPVYRRDDGSVECCRNGSETDLCFSYSYSSSNAKDYTTKYACLPVRRVLGESRACGSNADCRGAAAAAAGGGGGGGGDAGALCVWPALGNGTRLLRVVHAPRPHTLYVGHPLQPLYSVTMSDYVPRFTFLSIHLPTMLETFCKYLVSLSGALALVNSVPCFALDGQWILTALLELVLTGHERVASLVLLGGTALLAGNVCLGMWTLVAGQM